VERSKFQANRRISNPEYRSRRVESLRSDFLKINDRMVESTLISIFLDKIDGIPSFDIRYLIFAFLKL